MPEGNEAGTLIQSGTLAARPAFGIADRYYWATDIMEMYRDTGVAWELVALPMPFTQLVVANYYASPMVADNMGANSVIGNNEVAGQIYPCRKTATYDRIGVDIQTSDVAGSYRLGIYADNGAGYPGALIRDAGAVLLNGVAPYIASLPLAPPVQLIAGRIYWLVFVSNTNIATIYLTFDGGVSHPYLGHDTRIRGAYSSIQGVLAFGALPNPFPAGIAYNRFQFALGLRLISVP